MYDTQSLKITLVHQAYSSFYFVYQGRECLHMPPGPSGMPACCLGRLGRIGHRAPLGLHGALGDVVARCCLVALAEDSRGVSGLVTRRVSEPGRMRATMRHRRVVQHLIFFKKTAMEGDGDGGNAISKRSVVDAVPTELSAGSPWGAPRAKHVARWPRRST